MFTAKEISAAHSQVKSGADFPAYIHALKKLGVTYYETFVHDGHTDYHGANDYKITSPAKYEALDIDKTCNEKKFSTDLKDHQAGKTNYPTFCNDAAKSGIEKWIVDTKAMTCRYYDRGGNLVLTEQIPG